MQYLVLSDDKFIVNKQTKALIDKLIKDNSELDVVKYSFLNESCQEIFNAIFTKSLLGEKRIFVINDCNFIGNEKSEYFEGFSNEIAQTILEYNGDEIIIFTAVIAKVVKTNKFYKILEKKANIIELNSPNESEKRKKLIADLEKNNIEYDIKAIDLFMSKIPNNDMFVYSNEKKKLIELNQKVDVELINNILGKYIVFDFFEMVNCFLQKKVSDFIKLFKNYMLTNNNTLGFLTTISNSLILTRDIVFLKNQNKSNSEIASMLEANPYRVNILLKNNKLSLSELNDSILKVHDIIWKSTNGIIDSKIIPEFELINMLL